MAPFLLPWALSLLSLVPPPARAFSSSPGAVVVDAAGGSAASFWKWRGHDVFAEVRAPPANASVSAGRAAGGGGTTKPAVVLLHGFGASSAYWRETASALHGEGYAVHALDLLGQGRSSKPFLRDDDDEGRADVGDDDAPSVEGDDDDGPMLDAETMGRNTNARVEYSIDLWANLVDDYARDRQLGEVVLMGNSLGSLVALSAATGDFAASSSSSSATAPGGGYLAGEDGTGKDSRVAGLCLFNCGVGLNSRNIVKNAEFGPVRRAMLNALFDMLNALIFDNEAVLRYALDHVVTRESLGNALRSLYTHSPERVDRYLVDSFYRPATSGGDGAVEAIRQIYTNNAGLTPMEFHEKYPKILDALPIHLIWGSEDVVTPIDGDVGWFYRDRVANNRGGKGMTSIDVVSSGHMPFDDNPVVTNEKMMRWLRRKVSK